GSWPGWLAYWALMLATARSSSLRRMTSSSTTATIESIGVVAWAAAGPGTKAVDRASRAARTGAKALFMQSAAPAPRVSTGIIKNSIIKQAGRVAAEAADAVQLDLKIDAGALLVAKFTKVTTAQHPHRDAAALPFDAGQGLEALAVA